MAAIMPTSPNQPTLFDPAQPADATQAPPAVEPAPDAPAADTAEAEAPHAEAASVETTTHDAHAPEQAELTMPAPAPATSPPARGGRRPWWTALLAKVLDPWIELRIEPLPESCG